MIKPRSGPRKRSTTVLLPEAKYYLLRQQAWKAVRSEAEGHGFLQRWIETAITNQLMAEDVWPIRAEHLQMNAVRPLKSVEPPPARTDAVERAGAWQAKKLEEAAELGLEQHSLAFKAWWNGEFAKWNPQAEDAFYPLTPADQRKGEIELEQLLAKAPEPPEEFIEHTESGTSEEIL